MGWRGRVGTVVLALVGWGLAVHAAEVPQPAGTNLLKGEGISAYRPNGAGVKGEIVPVEGQLFTKALQVTVGKKPEKVHEVNISASNATPLKKGDIVYLRFSARSAMKSGAEGVAQLYVQSSKNWAKALDNHKVTLTKEWQTWVRFFRVEEDYEPNTVFFNIFLGFQEQTLEFANIAVVNCGQEKSIEDLRKETRLPKLVCDFESEFVPVKVDSKKSKIQGVLPSLWQDDSAWADVDVTYERMTANAFEGTGALRVRAETIRGGAVQLRIPGISVSKTWFIKVKAAFRSSTSTSLTFGVRKTTDPYNFYAERTISAVPEWGMTELLVPPVAEDPVAALMVCIKSPGVVEIDAVSVEYLAPEEVVSGGDLLGKNLFPTSSFPDGLHAPWSPFNDGYRPENYVTDPTEIGPTGQPALKITTVRYENRGAAQLTVPFFGAGGKKHTFSLWIKAKVARHQIFLRMGPPSATLYQDPYQKSISLTTSWKRYDFTLELPFTSDGFYLAQVANFGDEGTFWIDGLQMEVGETPSDFKRTDKVEVVLQPDVPYGLWTEGQPLRVRASVYGGVEAGMVLKSELFDVYGKNYPMPDRPVPAGGMTKEALELPEVGQPPLGGYRLESHVVDAKGNRVSKIAEALLYRVREPRYGNELRPDSPFGIHLTPNHEMPKVARKLGFTWVRLLHHIMWLQVEPEPGVWKFEGSDAAIDVLHGAKFCVLAAVEGVPERERVWVMPKPAPKGYNNFHAKNVPPKNLDALKTYTQKMAERYRGKVQAWETWNEPFLPGFLNAGIENEAYIHPSPEEFFKMHKAAAEGIRQGDPQAKVVINMGAHYNEPAATWSKRVLALGAFDTVDVVSYHKYHPSSLGFPGDVIHVATEAHRPPPGKKVEIWNSEGGPGPSDIRNFYRHVPPLGKTDASREWADYMVRYYVSTLASGAKRFFLFTIHSWGTWRNDYSPLNVDGRLHPNLIAISNLAWHIEGRPFVKCEELAPDLYAYCFEGDGAAVAIVLSKGVARQPLDAIPEGLTATDVYGNVLKTPCQLGDGPMFFTGKALKHEHVVLALQGKPLPPEVLAALGKAPTAPSRETGAAPAKGISTGVAVGIGGVALALILLLVFAMRKKEDRPRRGGSDTSANRNSRNNGMANDKKNPSKGSRRG